MIRMIEAKKFRNIWCTPLTRVLALILKSISFGKKVFCLKLLWGCHQSLDHVRFQGIIIWIINGHWFVSGNSPKYMKCHSEFYTKPLCEKNLGSWVRLSSQLSHEKKQRPYFPFKKIRLLFHRHPYIIIYNDLLESPHNWVVCHPRYILICPSNQGCSIKSTTLPPLKWCEKLSFWAKIMLAETYGDQWPNKWVMEQLQLTNW